MYANLVFSTNVLRVFVTLGFSNTNIFVLKMILNLLSYQETACIRFLGVHKHYFNSISAF